MKNRPRYSPPPQRPRRLPPLIVDDPFRYRRTLDLDFSSDVDLESGISYSRNPPLVTNDHHKTNLPDWEEYDEEVKLNYQMFKNKIDQSVHMYSIDDIFMIMFYISVSLRRVYN